MQHIVSPRCPSHCGSPLWLAAAGSMFAAAPAAAQAVGYPSFQPPMVVDREYAVGVAGGDAGTSLVFQWREAWSAVSHLSFDGGLYDPKGDNTDVKLLLGAGYARQLTRSTEDLPLDLLLTAGAYTALADPVILQVPIGISAGHRFELDQGMAITPYLHPRVALSYVSSTGASGDSNSDIGISFDIGANYEVTRRLSLRGALTFGDNNNDGIGFAVAWRPGVMGR